MSLLLPDAGLLFWMLLSFGIVFLVLYKFGFPIITSMLDERKKFIDDSLRNAAEANERLARIEQDGEAIIAAAKEEHARMLRETAVTREQLLAEARRKAADESERIVEEARKNISQEREEALSGVRTQVAELSLEIASKVLRKELSGDERSMAYTMELVDEALAKEKDKE